METFLLAMIDALMEHVSKTTELINKFLMKEGEEGVKLRFSGKLKLHYKAYSCMYLQRNRLKPKQIFKAKKTIFAKVKFTSLIG